MALKCYLTVIKKVKIDILKKAFSSNVKIAKEIDRSEHVVRNYLKLGKKHGLKPKTKGNQKLSSRAILKVIYEATRKRLSASQIKADLDLSVTKQRFQHVLSTSLNVSWQTPMRKPALKSHHKQTTSLIWMDQVVSAITGMICGKMILLN